MDPFLLEENTTTKSKKDFSKDKVAKLQSPQERMTL